MTRISKMETHVPNSRFTTHSIFAIAIYVAFLKVSNCPIRDDRNDNQSQSVMIEGGVETWMDDSLHHECCIENVTAERWRPQVALTAHDQGIRTTVFLFLLGNRAQNQGIERCNSRQLLAVDRLLESSVPQA